MSGQLRPSVALTRFSCKAEVLRVDPTRLELVTSAMPRQGRGFVAVHWGSRTPANSEIKWQLYSGELPRTPLHWCTTGVPACPQRYSGIGGRGLGGRGHSTALGSTGA